MATFVPELLLFIAYLALLALSIRPFRGLWNGSNAAEFETIWRRFWIWGDASLRAWLRSTISLYLAGWFGLMAYGSAVLLDFGPKDLHATFIAFLSIGFLGICAMVVLALAVALFNTPRLLVPPSLRAEKGLVRAMWQRRNGGGRR